MIKITILSAILVLADTSPKTILQDLRDYEEELRENFSNTKWYLEYIEKKDKEDPCDPFVPITPDISNLETLSERKCKEYMWYFKNEMNKETQQQHCEIHKIYLKNKDNVNPNQSSGGVPGVYGGRAVEIAEFPHMGAVGWKSKNPFKEWVFKCGGSLISDKFLLTAAHCTKLSPRFVSDIVNGDPEVVMLGVEDITNTKDKDSRQPSIVKVKNIIVHPEYKSPKKYNDIALLEVDTIKFTQFIKPACVWPHENIKAQGKVYLTGWGETESGTPASHLQAGEVELLDILRDSTCDDLLKPYHNRNWNGFTDRQMCAGKLEGRVDTCQGDSGGPLQVKLEPIAMGSMSLVVGVTSFGIRCGVRNQPGVYTRVASYIDWIEQHVWK